MQRDQESLIDIANSIRRVLRYANGISKSELESNDEKLSAILDVVWDIVENKLLEVLSLIDPLI